MAENPAWAAVHAVSAVAHSALEEDRIAECAPVHRSCHRHVLVAIAEPEPVRLVLLEYLRQASPVLSEAHCGSEESPG